VIDLPLHELFLATIVRWLGLLGLAAVTGSLVLDLLVLPREAEEVAVARRRLRKLSAAAVGVLIFATAGELLMRTRAMSGGELTQVRAALPLVLTRTHFGTIWMARVASLGLLLLVSFLPSTGARATGLLLALGVALTTSLTGHAADWGDRSFTVLVDWGHAVAAGAWAGGLFGLALVILGGRTRWSSTLLGVVGRRFSRLAGYCLLVVVATGVYNVWTQVPALAALWTTTYGRVLLLKVVLASILAFLGAINRFVVLPGLGSDRARRRGGRWLRLGRIVVFGTATVARSSAASRLSRFVGREALVALLVFGCTAVLGESTPKRHEGHASHGAAPEGAPFRVTMEALHAGDGVPKGWSFAPPVGDAMKGREVFRRLECFTCHAVDGERFPRPSKPGPALTGVGRHHPPGYLLESIMNPNAVIVEAPGYTGADGRSTMPDYRDSLSAGDLIDLVAYLKSLGG